MQVERTVDWKYPFAPTRLAFVSFIESCTLTIIGCDTSWSFIKLYLFCFLLSVEKISQRLNVVGNVEVLKISLSSGSTLFNWLYFFSSSTWKRFKAVIVFQTSLFNLTARVSQFLRHFCQPKIKKNSPRIIESVSRMRTSSRRQIEFNQFGKLFLWQIHFNSPWAPSRTRLDSTRETVMKSNDN